jgi:hypothetical protein
VKVGLFAETTAAVWTGHLLAPMCSFHMAGKVPSEEKFDIFKYRNAIQLTN